MTSSWVFSFSLAPSLEKAWNTWNAPEGRWTINEWWAWTRLWKPQWKVHPSSEGLQHVMSFGDLWFVVLCKLSCDMSVQWCPHVLIRAYRRRRIWIYIYICVYIYWFEYILNRFTYSSPSPVSHVVCARDCSMSCGPLCSLVERVFKRLSVLQHWLPFQLAVVSLLRRTSTKKKKMKWKQVGGLEPCCVAAWPWWLLFALCGRPCLVWSDFCLWRSVWNRIVKLCCCCRPFCSMWSSFHNPQKKRMRRCKQKSWLMWFCLSLLVVFGELVMMFGPPLFGS